MRYFAIILLLVSSAAAQTIATAIGGATGYQNVPNDTTTGTLLNGTACYTSAGAAVVCGTATTGGVIGICAANCGTGTTVNPLITGTTGQIMACVFDGATTAGDFVTVSTITPGNCHDAGTTAPSLNLGRVRVSSSGTVNIIWRGSVDPGATGGATFTANAIQYATSTTASRAATAADIGTLGTLSNAVSGNAATATNLSTNGTANQVWGMNAGATAQGWQTFTASITFPQTVGGTVNAVGIPYFNTTTQMSSSATIPNGSIPCAAAGAITASGTFTNQGIMTGSTTVCPTTPGPTLTGSSFAWAQAGTFSIQGGASSSGVHGGLVVSGSDLTGTGGATSTGRPTVFRSSNNNSSTSANAIAAALGVYGGAATGATTPAHEGFLEWGQYFLKGTTNTLWNLQCQSGTAETVTDCGATPAYIIGVAQNTTGTSVLVIEGGEAPINFSNTPVVGHTACAGATAGQATDSGGTGACSTGFMIGVINRITGSYTLANGTALAGSGDAVTLTTTAPAIASVIMLGRR